MSHARSPSAAQRADANAGDQYWEVVRTLWRRPNDPWWDDVATPQKEDRDQTVTAALQAAAGQLENDQGSDPTAWNWGEAHTVSAVNQTLGKSGIAPIERIFNRGPLPVGGEKNDARRPSATFQ